MHSLRSLPVALLVAALTAGCGGSHGAQDAPNRAAAPDDGLRTVTTKQISAGVMGIPATLYEKLLAPAAGSVPGVDALEELLNAGLGHFDNRGALLAQLAEAVPTLENGLWEVSPDGRMQTTWRIKSSARWHDGAPVTSEDLLFSVEVGQDKDLQFALDAAFASIDGFDAPDPQTLRIRWNKPYIQADSMFTSKRALPPLPRHLLQATYSANKAGLTQLPYWNEEFVGTGPYRVREWVAGSHIVMDANEQYVLGRPKIDRLEVKFIPDANTLIANLLAGSIELSLGRNLSLDQARQLTQHWTDGRMEVAVLYWLNFYPQFIDPRPAVVADARFRRALLYATDRQQLVDTLQAGLVPIADSMVNPGWPEYAAIEKSIVRYEYDPRKAAQMVEGLGYDKRPDGFFYDASGQKLAVELRTITSDINQKALLAVAQYWERLGVDVDTVVVPPQRARDREYRATFPGFEMTRPPNELGTLVNYQSARIPVPANSFTGENKARYSNADVDLLVDRYFTTIPTVERWSVLGDIVHHLTSELITAGLFYDAEPTEMSNRLMNVTARSEVAAQGWNAQDWDLR